MEGSTCCLSQSINQAFHGASEANNDNHQPGPSAFEIRTIVKLADDNRDVRSFGVKNASIKTF
jgi:hypothetical protein